MSNPVPANLYTQGFGSRPENVEIPTYQTRAPTTTDTRWPIGKRWIDQSSDAEYTLTSLDTNNGVVSATWIILGGGSSAVATETGDTGTATPSGGNIKHAGTANQIVTSASGSTITYALTGPYTPATYTAHGVLVGEGTSSIVATAVGATGTALMGNTGADPSFTGSPSFSGSVTAATTITATLGDITASNGNFVLGTAGNKLVSTSVASTTTAGANSFGTVTLVGGTATISTTAVTASSIIMLTRQSVGATGAAALGELTIGTITAATSFVINAVQAADATALQASDVSVIGWMIIN